MTSTPLWSLTASQLASSIRSGAVSAVAVVEAHLDRIAEVNATVNALTVVFPEQALALAREVDAAIAAGEEVGALAGVPFSVKENIDITWSASTSAATFLAHAVPPRHAIMIERMLAAGAIPIARGNMPDFGLRWDTDNDLFGRAYNPWNSALTPGGSSAGDAIAVATGMAPIGLGNDYGGSLRLPASAAGVVALRPSAGRIPAPTTSPEPVPLSLQHFAVNGPIARSVDDLDLAFGIMQGAHPTDPLAISVPHPASYEGPRRVAVVRDPLGWGIDASVDEAITRAAAALAAAGWELVEVEPPMIEEAAGLWRQISSTEMAGAFAPGALPLPLSDGSVKYFTDNVSQTQLLDTAESYAAAWAKRVVIAGAWSAFQAEYPVVLGPVSAREPFPIGYDLEGPEATTELWRRHRLLVTVNFLGLPSVALPTGVGASGLPLGVQLIAALYQDHVALAAARDVEAGNPAITPINPRS